MKLNKITFSSENFTSFGLLSFGRNFTLDTLLNSNLKGLCLGVVVVKDIEVEGYISKGDLMLWVPLENRATNAHPSIKTLATFGDLFIRLLKTLMYS